MVALLDILIQEKSTLVETTAIMFPDRMYDHALINIWHPYSQPQTLYPYLYSIKYQTRTCRNRKVITYEHVFRESPSNVIVTNDKANFECYQKQGKIRVYPYAVLCKGPLYAATVAERLSVIKHYLPNVKTEIKGIKV